MTAIAFSPARRAVLAGAAGLALMAAFPAATLAADDPDISDREALKRQKAGEMIIVDVRTPPEWRQTGIAEGALTIEMQDPQFLQKVMQLRLSHPDKQIGFICASSNRSGQVQQALAQRGFSDVFSIYGGMTGNGKTPGWIADGLPTQPWSGQ